MRVDSILIPCFLFLQRVSPGHHCRPVSSGCVVLTGVFADLTVIVLFCYKVASRMLIPFCCRPERMLRQEASDLWLESDLRRTFLITGIVLPADQKTLSAFT